MLQVEQLQEMVTNFTGNDFELSDWNTWSPKHFVVFWVVLMLGQDLMHFQLEMIGKMTNKRIPESGKFLDKLGWKDWAFVILNRFLVPPMIYHMIRFTMTNPNHIEWDMAKMTPLNTVGSVIALFMVYDLFYVPFHAFLHVRAVYPWIHKHHHANAAPTRGNLDASNTHPIEFIIGEYLHLVAVYLVPSHIVAVFAFIAIGGVLASLNHTRIDIAIPFFYDVRAHDKHHHIPTANYGQYTMWLDRVVGSFQEHTKPAIHLKKA